MISVSGGWVFVHPKKTAGTSIARALLPYSDDRLKPIPGMDPSEDFEIVGPITPSKHTPWRYYRAQVGPLCDELILIGGTRHPLERMLSLYFYWQRRRSGASAKIAGLARAGGSNSRAKESPPYFNDQSFVSLVAHTASMADSYRRPDGSVKIPDITVEPHRVGEAVREIEQRCGLDNLPISHHNKAPANPLLADLRRSASLAAFVYDAHHEDYAAFGYDILPKR